MNWEERLTFHEGMKLTPYKCTSGKTTIGVGHNCEAREFTDEEKKAIGDWRKGITKNMALMILRNDMEICLKDLKTFPFWKQLDEERQYALLDICFNIGFAGLKKFRKMLNALVVKDYLTASTELLDSKYATQTGKRAKRIAKLIRTGRWEI